MLKISWPGLGWFFAVLAVCVALAGRKETITTKDELESFIYQIEYEFDEFKKEAEEKLDELNCKFDDLEYRVDDLECK